ncbi:MAG: hypothetical protein R6X31_05150, partial [Anaerolineae bacterium]
MGGNLEVLGASAAGRVSEGKGEVVREEVPPRSGGWSQARWVEETREGFSGSICAAGEDGVRSRWKAGRRLMG